jgi:hypothetical protein
MARLAVNRNEFAMASFSITFTTVKTMIIIYTAFLENFLDGEAHLVLQELYKRYKTLDTVSKVEMSQHNLLSVGMIMNYVWKLESDVTEITLDKDKRNLPLISRLTQQEEFCLQ